MSLESHEKLTAERQALRTAIRALRQHLEAKLDPKAARQNGMTLVARRCAHARGLPEPPEPALESSIEALPDGLFSAPEALGWAYQEWRREQRDQLFAHLRQTRAAKIEGEQTLLATQLYTEPYMVRFLVENALAACCDAQPPLNWSYRLAGGGDRPAEALTILDPACGTGHLLLGAFEALLQLQREAQPDASPAAIAQRILTHQLFGLDLDAEAVAVARRAIALRARELAPALDPAALDALKTNLLACGALGEAGTLARQIETPGIPGALQRLLAVRYDVILTNPPFLGPKTMGPALRAHLKTHYAEAREDVQTAFLTRCRELVRPGGVVAAVSMRAWLYQAAFRRFRERVFREDSLLCFADLGAQAFEEALGLHEGVSVMLTCFRRAEPAASHQALGVRVGDPTGPAAKAQAMRAAIAEPAHPRRHRLQQASLFALSEAPFCYALPASALTAIAQGSSLAGRVKQGLATTDNERFLRYDWEVAPEDTNRWVRIARGGTYRKWWGLEQVRVDWADDGATIKALIPQKYPYLKDWRWVAKNADYYFKPGLTYSYMCYGSLSARVMQDAIFEVASIGVFPEPEDTPLVLATLNARTASWMLRGLSQKHMFQAGMVEKLPMPKVSAEARAEISALVDLCVTTKRTLATFDPLEAVFEPARLEAPLAVIRERQDALAAVLHTAEGRLETLICEGYGLEGAAIAQLTAETGVPVGWHPLVAERDQPLATLPDALFPLAAHPRKPRPAMAKTDTATPASADWGPLPCETPLEAIAHRLGVHPLSAYWLMREDCPDATRERELAEDVLTVEILHLLGHRWPGEEAADTHGAGIIPLTGGSGEPTLAERLRQAFDPGAIAGLEAALGEPLELWLMDRFFRRHATRFKKRPIAWLLGSKPPRGDQPAFACVIYFHRLDETTCAQVRALAERLPSSAERDGFLARLLGIEQTGDVPDRHAGVRANLAPLQRAGLLACDVLARRLEADR